MRYAFYTCDVFTDTRFGGNPLAVLPEAQGLSDTQMQQIAREFNYSESTFVLPSETGHTRKVRIFTPTTEVPFAGHPNIGTAFTLAHSGKLGDVGATTEIVFEEEAGLVPVTIHKKEDGGIWCELKAPEPLTIGTAVSVELVASALSINAGDIITTTHSPQVASVGLPFIMVEVKDLETLERVRIDTGKLEKIAALGIAPDIHVYIHSHDNFDIRSRMFAPLDNVPEDPATGSANCALVGMLSHYNTSDEGGRWHIAQGVEMKRPSVLEARTQKEHGEVIGVWIAGSCVMVSEGHIEVG